LQIFPSLVVRKTFPILVFFHFFQFYWSNSSMFPILVAILLYQIWVGLTGWISFRPETRFGEHFEGHTCLFSQPDPSHVYTKIDMLFTLKMGKVLKNHSFRKNMEHSQKNFFSTFFSINRRGRIWSRFFGVNSKFITTN